MRGQPKDNNAHPVSISPEEIIAVIAGIFTIINEVLPVIPFWWRFTSLVVFFVLIADLCLRSKRIIRRVRSASHRVFLSMVTLAFIIAVLWNPMRKQYMEEHRPPNLLYLIGSPLGDNDSPVWMMMLNHYGSSPAYNCDVDFYDNDRININHSWLVAHPNIPFAPAELVGEFRKTFHIGEVDPGLGAVQDFEWTPIDPDHQHYGINITCRDGQFVESWEVNRIKGILRTQIKLGRALPTTEKNPELERRVFFCTDKDFSTSPLASVVPPALQKRPFNPGWKPSHLFIFPAMIIDSNRNLEEMTIDEEYAGCWIPLTKHLGDAHLPLTLPSENRVIAVAGLIYALLVFVLPLYSLLAFWVMGVPDLFTSERTNTNARSSSAVSRPSSCRAREVRR